MKNYPYFYEQLNLRQREAVDHIAGPLLVLAGPGTGKTQLLSVRAGSILNKTSAKAENILILTYTNSAAKAMKERLAKIIGQEGYDIEVGTFHSFANYILQESVEAANYITNKILISDIEQIRALEYIIDNTDGLDDIRPFRSPYTYLKDIQKKISDLKKDDISPQFLRNYLNDKNNNYMAMEDKYIKRLQALATVYERYEEIKKGKTQGIFDGRGRYDFDDMILFAVEAINNEPELKSDLMKQYKYIMVDEYQDTNGAQLDLLFSLTDHHDANLCCVGDDDQSIYRFQGANTGNFKKLYEKFKNLYQISLTDNYRSTEKLISASKKIIDLIPVNTRVTDKRLKSNIKHNDREFLYKEFTTEEEEMIFLVKKVREIKDIVENDLTLNDEDRAHPYNSIAILVRKRAQILKIIDTFLREGIPYATDGKEDIRGESRVIQLMDVLELANINPIDIESRDLFLYRVLTADYFQIPLNDVLKFIKYANENKGCHSNGKSTILMEFIRYFSNNKDHIFFEDPEKFNHAYKVIKKLLDNANNEPVHSLIINFIKDAGIYSYILKDYSDKKILKIRQLRSIGSFITMIKQSDLANPGIKLSELLKEFETRKNHGIPIQGDLVTLTQEGVRIYTAHGAKGLEFRSVIIPFCLQNKSWPVKTKAEKIPLPFDLLRNKLEIQDKEKLKELSFYDETRLFYVAITRAKTSLIFTASPGDDQVATSYIDTLSIKNNNSSDNDDSEESLIGQSLNMTDLKDPFIGTENILKDMISNITLNPTRLNNYILCKRKFFYNDILKLPGLKKKSLIFGNCVHKALEDTYKKFKSTGIFPKFDFFEDSFQTELCYQGIDTAMERDLSKKIKTLKTWFQKISINPVMPIDLEKKLVITIGDNIIFTGKYDKVEWDDESKGLVRILDYKTGKPDDHIKNIDKCHDLSDRDCDGYLRQLVSYKLLFDKNIKESNGRKASSGALVFVEPVSVNIARSGIKKGDFITKSVSITDNMVEELEAIIKKVWSDIKNLHFEKLNERDEDVCDKCDFNSMCWEKI